MLKRDEELLLLDTNVDQLYDALRLLIRWHGTEKSKFDIAVAKAKLDEETQQTFDQISLSELNASQVTSGARFKNPSSSHLKKS